MRVGYAVLAVVLFLSSSFECAGQTPPPNIDTVQVLGQRVGGGAYYCMGVQCSQSYNQAALQTYMQYQAMYASIPDEELPVEPSLFCSILKNKKPSGCDAINPPIVPGINLNWQPNGCGTGPIEDWVYAQGLGALNSSFSGNLDAPYAGVSFLSACNSHDRCYGLGSVRESCDIDFRDAMQSSCDAFSDPGAYQTCSSFVSTYHAAVSSNFGTSAYNNAQADLRCAVWVKDMKENQCSA